MSLPHQPLGCCLPPGGACGLGNPLPWLQLQWVLAYGGEGLCRRSRIWWDLASYSNMLWRLWASVSPGAHRDTNAFQSCLDQCFPCSAVIVAIRGARKTAGAGPTPRFHRCVGAAWHQGFSKLPWMFWVSRVLRVLGRSLSHIMSIHWVIHLEGLECGMSSVMGR